MFTARFVRKLAETILLQFGLRQGLCNTEQKDETVVKCKESTNLKLNPTCSRKRGKKGYLHKFVNPYTKCKKEKKQKMERVRVEEENRTDLSMSSV